MRALFPLVLVVAGCAGATTVDGLRPATVDEEPAAVRVLPGEPAGTWPIAVAWAGGRYLLPFRDASGALRVLLTDPDEELALDGDRLIGAVPSGDGFIVATSGLEGVVVHFLNGGQMAKRIAPLPGDVIRGLAASRGSALVGAMSGGELQAAIVRPDAAWTVALPEPFVGPPQLWGDDAGFVVGRAWLLDPSGRVERAPAQQLESARLFREVRPEGDTLTADGDRWLALDGSVAWARSDNRGAVVGLDDAVLHVGADLTPMGPPRSLEGGGWLRELRADRALWETVAGSDHLFAILERMTLSFTGPRVRVTGSASRTVAVALGEGDALVAWLTSGGACHFARVPR